MKSTLRICFFSTLLLLNFACSNTPPSPANTAPTELSIAEPTHTEQEKSNIGLLWEIRSDDMTSPSFLFGTVHSEDERVTNLPQEVSDAFNQANNLALEILLDNKTTKTVLKALYYNDGTKLKNLLSTDTYSRAINAMIQRGLEERITNRMKPWAVFTILSMPEQKTGLFLDAVLYQNAKTQKKNISGLETAKEQTAVFDEMPLNSQIALLESTLDHQADMGELLNEIIEVYLTRDLNKILAVNEKYETLIDEQLAKDFNQRLIVDRNYRMVERMQPILKKGNSFIAVGALHLPGEEGIISLLTQQGYQVEAKY